MYHVFNHVGDTHTHELTIKLVNVFYRYTKVVSVVVVAFHAVDCFEILYM